MKLVLYLIVLMSFANLLRMAGLLIIGDIYTLRSELRQRKALTTRRRGRPPQLPTVSIIIPAFNEETGILRTLRSVRQLEYPQQKLEIVVVNDGSTDATLAKARRYARSHKSSITVKVVNQKNQGKAAALNNGIMNHSSGKLVMCLDADSLLDSQALLHAARYFRDKSVVGLASNVNIIEDGTVLGLTQRLEYLIAHQVKKAQTSLNIDYIIGGIGSIFRRDMLRKVKYYDTNTMTEDIDLSMKMVSAGNRKHRLVYAADVITYTEAVPSFKSLVRQRYRWKYGRLQTFLKNHQLFFNRDAKYGKLLTLFVLPNTLFQEIIFLFEPFVVCYIIYNALFYRNVSSVLLATVIIGVYAGMNIWASEHLSVRQRVRLTLYAPIVYPLINIISLVDYLALIRSVANIRKLRASINHEHVTWVSPERSGLVASSS